MYVRERELEQQAGQTVPRNRASGRENIPSTWVPEARWAAAMGGRSCPIGCDLETVRPPYLMWMHCVLESCACVSRPGATATWSVGVTVFMMPNVGA